MDECPTQQKVLSLPYFKQTTMAETRKMTRTPKTSKAKPVDEYGHLQPQAPELEEAVLGALMIEKDAYSLVSEILRPESFYERRHQLIYSAITSLALRQQPVDILTVAEQLRIINTLIFHLIIIGLFEIPHLFKIMLQVTVTDMLHIRFHIIRLYSLRHTFTC